MNKKVVSSNFARLVRETPLIQKPFLVKNINHDSIQHKKMPNVFYKLENLQFSGSFKDRGLGFMIDTLHQQKPITKLICPSGGNAGNAVAVAGKTLGIPTEIYVPKTTLPMMIKIIESSNAKVIVTGNNWNEANEVAKEACQKDQNAKYIPAFDDPLIWEGHSFMIDEIVRQFQENPETKDIIPDALITCVGGGGLLRGMQLGLQRNNWLKTKIFAVETKGAASFAALKKHGKGSRLEKIDTIASTLGALQVIDCTLDSPIETESVVVSDADAVHACLSYANEFRMLVEPSCGSSLSLLYRSEFYERYLSSYENVLMIVCGGSAVSLELLQDWKKRFQL